MPDCCVECWFARWIDRSGFGSCSTVEPNKADPRTQPTEKRGATRHNTINRQHTYTRSYHYCAHVCAPFDAVCVFPQYPIALTTLLLPHCDRTIRVQWRENACHHRLPFPPSPSMTSLSAPAAAAAAVPAPPKPAKYEPPFLVHFAAGTLGGIFGLSLCYPLDTVKVR